MPVFSKGRRATGLQLQEQLGGNPSCLVDYKWKVDNFLIFCLFYAATLNNLKVSFTFCHEKTGISSEGDDIIQKYFKKFKSIWENVEFMCSVIFREKALQFFFILRPCCDLRGGNTATLQIIEKINSTPPCPSKHRHRSGLTEVSKN